MTQLHASTGLYTFLDTPSDSSHKRVLELDVFGWLTRIITAALTYAFPAWPWINEIYTEQKSNNRLFTSITSHPDFLT